LQHETALQRLTASIPSLLGGTSASSPQITQLQQQISLLQLAVAKLTSIDSNLKPKPGSH
jgi:hypothetical protein